MTKGGVVPQLETAAKTDDGENRKKVVSGDFVINSRSDRKGSAGLADEDGSVSLISIVLRPQEAVHGRFIHHLLRSASFQEEFYRFGKGIVADLWSTNYGEMRNVVLAMPPLDEQRAIAAFLEIETAKIDALVAEQRRLMDLLQEKRQAVISSAVTKGLNPDAPLKDTGVEWLGEVPTHWDIAPFPQVVRFQEGPGIMAADFRDEGVPLLRVSGVQGPWATLDGCNFLDPHDVERKWSHFRIEEGDLLLSSSASLGVISQADASVVGAVPYTGIIRLSPNGSRLNRDFLRSLLESTLFSRQIERLKTGATIQHFGPTHLRQMKITVPPPEEQTQISLEIERSTDQVHRLIQATGAAIKLLEERRAALITAAVTGQIDVRGLAAAEAA
ncbi:MAG: restriction endonuclease subunit S [Gemmatimonadaceae bacterium]